MKKIFKIIVKSNNQQSLEDLIRQNRLDVGCTGGITIKEEHFSIEVYASEKEITQLKKDIREKGLSEIISLDITEITDYLSDRLREVGTGDRYKDAKAIPRGLGTKVKQ